MNQLVPSVAVALLSSQTTVIKPGLTKVNASAVWQCAPSHPESGLRKKPEFLLFFGNNGLEIDVLRHISGDPTQPDHTILSIIERCFDGPKRRKHTGREDDAAFNARERRLGLQDLEIMFAHRLRKLGLKEIPICRANNAYQLYIKQFLDLAIGVGVSTRRVFGEHISASALNQRT